MEKPAWDLRAVTLDRMAGVYVTHPGGTLSATAGRGIALAGAQLQSEGDLNLKAGRDLNIDSVTTGRQEDIRWNGKMSRSTRESSETGTTITAAGSATLKADRDLTARAAILSAGETLTLDAGRDLTLYAGQNQTSAETSHATKSGMSHYSLDATSQQTSLARTTLTANDIQLRSGGDTTLAAVQAHADTLDIQTGGKLIFATQTTTEAASRQEAKGDAAFVSASGKGHVDEMTNYNQLNVGTLKIVAKGGVTAQIGERDTQATLAQQPGMGWVDQITNDPALAGRVDWQQVQEAHDKWQYRQSGLGPVSSALVMLVVAVATAGAGSAAVGSATGMTASSAAAAYPATTAAIQAGITSMASQATVSFMNNNDNLGKVFDELGSSASIKAIATSMVTAGAIQGLGTSGLLPDNLANATNGSASLPDLLGRQLIDNTASAVIRSGINGTSLKDELQQGIVMAFLNTAAAQGANWIGDSGPQGNQSLNAFAAEAAHAMLGCGIGAARAGSGDGCAAGALGAVAGHLASGAMPGMDPNDVLAVSQLIGGLAGALAGQGDQGVYIGAGAAGNAVANNRQLHPDESIWIKEHAKQYASQQDISEEEAIKILAQQAYRQVQFGAEGQWDASANAFLMQARGMLPPDGSSGPGYMFFATPAQKANTLMYAEKLPGSADIYIKAGIKMVPSAEAIAAASAKDAQQREIVSTLTVGAGVASSVIALASAGPTLLTWALMNPDKAVQVGLISAETGAGIVSGAITPTSVAEGLGKNVGRALSAAEKLAVQELTATLKVVAQQKAVLQQEKRVGELTQLFNRQSSTNSVTISGKNYATTAEGNLNGTTKVFDTTGMSASELERQVFAYAGELAGGQPLRAVDQGVWAVKLTDGTTINVRSVSSSGVGRWTVDLKDVGALETAAGKKQGTNFELKFK